MAQGNDKFCPEDYSTDVLREFTEFTGVFKYVYKAKMKPGWKRDATPEEIKQWKEVNMRQVFLGLHSSRTMQRIFEQSTTEDERDTITFSFC